MPSMTTAFSLAPKRLHEMNRLEDIGRFPTMIYVGATANVLASVLLFYWLHGYASGYLPVGFGCAVFLVAGNLLPVAGLRWRGGDDGLTDTPPIEKMSFFADQHRFPSWVYAVASANLFSGWCSPGQPSTWSAVCACFSAWSFWLSCVPSRQLGCACCERGRRVNGGAPHQTRTKSIKPRSTSVCTSLTWTRSPTSRP